VTSGFHNLAVKSISLERILKRSGDMTEKIPHNEGKRLDTLFGRELDIKGQFKDRLIHQHLKRDRKDSLKDFNEPSENSGDEFCDREI
jgi:hypothetical protein